MRLRSTIPTSAIPAIAILFLLSACSDPASPPQWTSLDIGPTQSLSGVWGSAADDVYIVGGSDDQGEAHHYDGTSWSAMEVPASVGLLVWSFGFGNDDVWAVGRLGAALHYDGSSWSEVDSKTDQDLWGVWGTASDDVYMVGGNVFSGQVTILHWDGSEISEEELPAEENPLGVRALFKVFGIDGRIFAVGQKGLIVERQATGWVRHSAGAAADEDFVALWGTSADDIIAVGGRASSRISTWDGSSWSTIVPTQGAGGLNAVYITEQGDILVGGLGGSIGHFDRETRDVVYEQSDTFIDVHAIWSGPDGVSYAVGGTFFEPHEGVVMSLEAK